MAERRAARIAWLVLSFLIAGGLLVALFRSAGVETGDLIDGLFALPIWAFAAICVMTFSNKFLGAYKWRTAVRWFDPGRDMPPVIQMAEATAWGSLFGQIVPPQVGSAAARWYMFRAHGAGFVVGTTIYEQAFDLIILLSAAIAGYFALTYADTMLSAGAIFALTVLATVSLAKPILRLTARIFGWLADTLAAGQTVADTLAKAFRKASDAPYSVVLKLCLWSTARLVLLIGRTAAVAVPLLPGVGLLPIAAGYPVAGILTALPILPAGIGVAEWTWTGFLVLGGASLTMAAVVAVLFRIVNLMSLLVAIAIFAVLRWSGRAGA